ncbi:MAG: hypothetical protein RIG62_05155 [Cyclobacteriaceae bacterium]
MKKYVIMMLTKEHRIEPLYYSKYSIKRDPAEDEFFDSEHEAVQFIEKYLAGFRENFLVLPVFAYA